MPPVIKARPRYRRDLRGSKGFVVIDACSGASSTRREGSDAMAATRKIFKASRSAFSRIPSGGSPAWDGNCIAILFPPSAV